MLLQILHGRFLDRTVTSSVIVPETLCFATGNQ